MLFVNSLLTGLLKAKHHSDPVPDVNNLEHEIEVEAAVEPPLPASIEQYLPTTIEEETELDIVHSDEPAGLAAEGLSKVVFDAVATGGIEHQSDFEQETHTSSAQDVVSGKDALTAIVAHQVEKVDAETEAATATNDLAPADQPETEQPAIPTTEVFIFFSLCRCVG